MYYVLLTQFFGTDAGMFCLSFHLINSSTSTHTHTHTHNASSLHRKNQRVTGFIIQPYSWYYKLTVQYISFLFSLVEIHMTNTFHSTKNVYCY